MVVNGRHLIRSQSNSLSKAACFQVLALAASAVEKVKMHVLGFVLHPLRDQRGLLPACVAHESDWQMFRNSVSLVLNTAVNENGIV